jgi:hypothetical protein
MQNKDFIKRLGHLHMISKHKKLAAILDSLCLEEILREYNFFI